MNKISKNIVHLIIIAFALLSFTNNYAAPPKGKTVFVHVISNIKTNDGPPCVAFDMAYANLMMGNKVEILFDADAAWNLKIVDKDKKNDFDRYEIPADLKKLVIEQFKDENINKLKTFGDFLSFMNKMGVKIYVNGTWNVLTSVEKTLKGKEKIPEYVTPLTLKEMTEVINTADVYMNY